VTTSASTSGNGTEGPVVLFDGVCNLCNSSVNFVIDHERDRDVRFASLQSEAGSELLERVGRKLPEGDPESIVVVEGGRVFERSAAILRIARHLRWPWRVLAAMAVVVPRPLRDVVYRWIARNRYRWFGKSDVCRVPTPELRERFLPGG
jgi:predicted DCC family thiol-disulfide oxidoreductase YuxK